MEERKIQKIDGWKCGGCGKPYETFSEAIDCCPPEKIEQCYKCLSCDGVYDDESLAKRCCEWKKEAE